MPRSGSERRSSRRSPHPSEPRPIRLDDFSLGSRTDLWLPLFQDSLGTPLLAPFVVVRGQHPGPVLGISAAVHGDELNGIRIIHAILERTDPAELHGTLVCAPIANVPAFSAEQRKFPIDGIDLNHVFPGKTEGKPSEQYARAFTTTFLPPLDYLIDIHTASGGRLNTFYVRADLHSPAAREMALLMNPQIVLHGRSGDGTLRNAARVAGVPAITVEAGNPSVFQGRMVLQGEVGVWNVMGALELIRGHQVVEPEVPPVICGSSRWLRTRSGGLLVTQFRLADRIKKRQPVAQIRDPFGHVLRELAAPGEGIVIGMSQSPLAVPGTRYCHLGAIGEPPPPRQSPTGALRRQLPQTGSGPFSREEIARATKKAEAAARAAKGSPPA